MDTKISLSRITNFIGRLAPTWIIFHPQKCWNTISAEVNTDQSALIKMIRPLAIMAIVFPVVGNAIFGINVENFGLFRAPLFLSLTNQTLEILMMICALLVDAWVIMKLAPLFQRSIDTTRSLSLVAYSSIPAFLGWVIGIVPALSDLKIIGFGYGFYLLFFGIDRMSRINENAPKNSSKWAFFSAAFSSILIVHILLHGLVEPIVPTPFFGVE